VQFILQSVRPDGSWPIDSNLATWVTTLSINALAAAGELPSLERRAGVRSWLVRQQFKSWHPYTNARPGGWGWTDLPGSVPDADDTSGALLALSHLTETVPEENNELTPRGLVRGMVADVDAEAAAQLPRSPDLSWESRPPIFDGLWWLVRLQNADGGWPTFCRGWGALPFDRSGTDLTAHALRAFAGWQRHIVVDQQYRPHLQTEIGVAHMPGFPLPDVELEIASGFEYLEKTQCGNGSWLPLWFGNQHAADETNPTYGTAKVLAAYRDHQRLDHEPARKAIRWLLDAQNADGGWGGSQGIASSIEETALAVEVLLDAGADARPAAERGLEWLMTRIEAGGLKEPTPIGFYFAKLWYYEKLYPIIFAVAALGRARQS
jgi:squalene-hopene/tetraprenyl-beta-curcumene cyclase